MAVEAKLLRGRDERFESLAPEHRLEQQELRGAASTIAIVPSGALPRCSDHSLRNIAPKRTSMASSATGPSQRAPISTQHAFCAGASIALSRAPQAFVLISMGSGPASPTRKS
jgi:hypothetical protein